MSQLCYWIEREVDGEWREYELLLQFTLTDYDPGVVSGPVEDCYPPEGGEIEDLRVTCHGQPFELTCDEQLRVEQFIESRADQLAEADHDAWADEQFERWRASDWDESRV